MSGFLRPRYRYDDLREIQQAGRRAELRAEEAERAAHTEHALLVCMIEKVRNLEQENRDATRLLAHAVLAAGGEVRITKRALVADDNLVLERRDDMTTHQIVFRAWREKGGE